MRSWTGRVRSLENLRYWVADQSFDGGWVDMVRLSCVTGWTALEEDGRPVWIWAVLKASAGVVLDIYLEWPSSRARGGATCEAANCVHRPRITSEFAGIMVAQGNLLRALQIQIIQLNIKMVCRL